MAVRQCDSVTQQKKTTLETNTLIELAMDDSVVSYTTGVDPNGVDSWDAARSAGGDAAANAAGHAEHVSQSDAAGDNVPPQGWVAFS